MKDENKLVALEGVLDALATDDLTSKFSAKHYELIEESREDYLKVYIEAVISWDDLMRNMKSKYGFFNVIILPLAQREIDNFGTNHSKKV